MITKTALVAAIIFGTASVALASEFDANLGNRYPQAGAQTAPMFEGRNVALTGGSAVVIRNESYIDRASRSFGGGY
jgi:hypothetical protein